MSAEAIASCWGPSNLTPAQRFVAIAVADVVNDAHNNEFWMRPEVLGEKVGMDAGNVRHRLSELVEAGVLEIVTPGGGRGRSTVYRWTLTKARGTDADSETASRTAETASRTPRNRVETPIPSLYRTKRTEQHFAASQNEETARATRTQLDRNTRRVKADQDIAPDPERVAKIRAIKKARLRERAS